MATSSVLSPWPALALAAGGACEGQPGERMPNFYGAYFRDPEGNKLHVVHRGP